jgi:chemotaxis signal transduction protein
MSTTIPQDARWALFSVGHRRIALPSDCLREVLPLPRLEPLRGALALRGTMPWDGGRIPVLGGRRLLGIGPAMNRAPNRPFWAREVHVPTELAVVLRVRGRHFAVSVDGVEAAGDGVTTGMLRDAARWHPTELVHLTLDVARVG